MVGGCKHAHRVILISFQSALTLISGQVKQYFNTSSQQRPCCCHTATWSQRSRRNDSRDRTLRNAPSIVLLRVKCKCQMSANMFTMTVLACVAISNKSDMLFCILIDGTEGTEEKIPDALWFIFWGPWMSVSEIIRSTSRRWTDWGTDSGWLTAFSRWNCHN